MRIKFSSFNSSSMSAHADIVEEDIPDNGFGNIVFDQNDRERPSWRFCNNVSLPRSEVMFFAQMFLIVAVISICSIKLLFFRANCEDSTLWFALFSGAVGFALPNPKL